MKYISPYRNKLSLALLFGLLKYGFTLIIPLILKYIIDEVILSESVNQQEKFEMLLFSIGSIFLIILIFRPIIEFFRQYYAFCLENAVVYDIRNDLFHHLQKLSLNYYANKKSGDIISRTVHDVDKARSFVITGLVNIWLDIATIFVVVIILLTMNAKLTLVALLVFPFYVFCVKYYYSRLKIKTKERSQTLANIQSSLGEKIQGISVIISFVLEDYIQNKFKKTIKNHLKTSNEHGVEMGKTFASVNTITELAPLLVIGYAGYQVVSGVLSIGTMVAFVAFLDKMYTPLKRLSDSGNVLTQSLASIERLFEVFDSNIDVKDKDSSRIVNEFEGEIEFKSVSFSYGTNEEKVLKDINLKINKGEKVALVGASGGGKSSLVGLIPRFYDIDNGEITIDKQNINSMKLKSLRKNIGIVFQDNILFSDSVFENIKLGNPEATDEEIFEASKKANAHDFILKLPKGYNTNVGERGVKLSGGQKQRIAIARMFLKNAKILILDEATSALDLKSERLIQELIDELSKDKTSIIVAHRLSTITHVDKIVVFKDGEIVETGKHDELIDLKAVYYNLYKIQKLS